MSDTSSESGSEDNAYVLHSPRLAPELQTSELQNYIEEAARHENGSFGFHARAVASQYRSLRGEHSVPRSATRRDSASSSMALTLPSRGTLASSSSHSAYRPSLADTVSTRPDSPSVRTSRADSIISNPYRLSATEMGPAVSSDPLQCPYEFLNCTREFDEFESWFTHWRAHFLRQPPRSIRCPFNCGESTSAESSERAWSSMQRHVARHFENGDVVDHAGRPDRALINALFAARAIGKAGFKELLQRGRLSDEPYLQTAGIERERRERRNQPRR